MDVNDYIAMFRAKQAQRLTQKPAARPTRYAPPAPPVNPLLQLGQQFVRWAQASHIAPTKIGGIPSQVAFSRKARGGVGWILHTATHDPFNAEAQYQVSYTYYYAVPLNGEIAWYSKTPTNTHYSTPYELPKLGSQESLDETKRLIAVYIVNSGSRVPWSGH